MKEVPSPVQFTELYDEANHATQLVIIVHPLSTKCYRISATISKDEQEQFNCSPGRLRLYKLQGAIAKLLESDLP